MKNPKTFAIFNENKIRRHWDDDKELWYFSIVDVISALTESKNPQVYWRVLKKRLIDEGSNETVTKCNALKMKALDGKMRLTDVVDTQVMLRLVQSIPSPKAEPFKLWLARVGYERLEETADPEISQKKKPKGFLPSKKIAKQGGTIAGNARREIENKTGKKVISHKNAKQLIKNTQKKLK